MDSDASRSSTKSRVFASLALAALLAAPPARAQPSRTQDRDDDESRRPRSSRSSKRRASAWTPRREKSRSSACRCRTTCVPPIRKFRRMAVRRARCSESTWARTTSEGRWRGDRQRQSGRRGGTRGLKAGDVLVEINGKSLKRDGDESPREKLLAGDARGEAGRQGDAQLSPRRQGRQGHRGRAAAEGSHLHDGGPGDRRQSAHCQRMPDFAFMRADGVFGSAELVPLTPKLGQYFGTEKGLLVVRAPADSRLKLEDGDVIVDIDGRTPSSPTHAFRILGSYQAGEKLKLNVLRMKKRMSFDVTIPEDARGSSAIDGCRQERDLERGLRWTAVRRHAPIIQDAARHSRRPGRADRDRFPLRGAAVAHAVAGRARAVYRARPMRRTDFAYDLPDELIAQRPPSSGRGAACCMCSTRGAVARPAVHGFSDAAARGRSARVQRHAGHSGARHRREADRRTGRDPARARARRAAHPRARACEQAAARRRADRAAGRRAKRATSAAATICSSWS